MSASVLEVRDLAIEAGGVSLLDGLTLELRSGEIVALLGPSGCGKTTLLRVLAGLANPAAGRIDLEGRPPGEWGWPVYRRRAVWVAQRPTLFEGSVRDNLARPFQYRTARRPFPEAVAAALLERLRVERECMGQEAGRLSEGQRQRVCLARSLLLEPRVLLMDEPTSALDEDATAAAEALIREEAAQRGLAALVVTHDRGQAARWCDRAIEPDWKRARPDTGAEGEARDG